MALTLEQAMRLNQTPVGVGVCKENVTFDPFFGLLKFRPMRTAEEGYKRENSLGNAGWVARNSGTVSESAATFARVTGIARTLVEDVDVPGIAAEMPDDPENQIDVQTMLKVRKAGQQIAAAAVTGSFATSLTVTLRPVGFNGDYVDALVAASAHSDTTQGGTAFLKYTHAGTLLQYRAPGDTAFGTAVACASDGDYTLYSANPAYWIRITLDVSDADENGHIELTLVSSGNQPDGLNNMIVPGSTQEVSSSGAAGDAFGLGTLDELDRLVTVGRGDLAFMMNGVLEKKFKSAMRSLGGATIDTVMLPGFGKPVMTYNGIPILRNDNIPSTESKGGTSTLTSAYLVSLEENEGFTAWYVGAPTAQIADLDPMKKSMLGFRIEAVGARPTVDARITRVKWYGCFRLGSTKAVARAKELITV